MTETTEDGFLGGRLTVEQPARGYRAGIDPVLLAAAVPALSGESVLELGTGVGTAILCLGHRVPGLELVAVERHQDLAMLARRNLDRNGIEAQVVTADLADMPELVKGRHFDHVIANPPFFDRQKGSEASVRDREGGRGENTPLALWIDTAIRRLRPKGRLTMIQRSDRLPDLLSAVGARLGDIRILPICGRQGRPSETLILTGRKGTKGALKLLSPFVLHEGDRHDGDRDSYRPEARAILRDGGALPPLD